MGTIIVGDFKSHKASRMPLHILQVVTDLRWPFSFFPLELRGRFHNMPNKKDITLFFCFYLLQVIQPSSHPTRQQLPGWEIQSRTSSWFAWYCKMLPVKKNTCPPLPPLHLSGNTWRSKLDREWLWQPKSTVVASKSQSWWRIAAAEAKEKSPRRCREGFRKGRGG